MAHLRAIIAVFAVLLFGLSGQSPRTDASMRPSMAPSLDLFPYLQAVETDKTGGIDRTSRLTAAAIACSCS